ncbi:R3H domain protein, partial [Geosmithia morbida]
VAASVSAEKPAAPPSPKANQSSARPRPSLGGPVIANGGGPRLAQAQNSSTASSRGSPAVDRVSEKLGGLSIQPKPADGVPGADGPSLHIERPQAMSRQSIASDESQRADSSSELGTKPPSLDGKSITSGATFALDEKESLRPDDSASVKAAAEDDDSISVRGSMMAGSRVSSDLAARNRGAQLADATDRRLMQATPGSSGQDILAPQSTESEQQVATAETSSDTLNVIYRHAPDEKLVEAMGTPKDRMYLLRLEKDVVEFVQNSKEPFMDLPPSNSFCRMLAHKLADYYHMTHSFEPNIGVVRIFRTPFCRVPTSLVHWDPAPNPSSTSTPPPAIQPKMIMRRGQGGDASAASGTPSKPTSEAESDDKDNKEKPQGNARRTREEREEIYKLARERIFGNAEDNGNDSEKSNAMSRTSSVSGNLSAAGKGRRAGRHRRDDSDGFDSRHQYAPYWGPQQQTWVPRYAPTPAGQGAVQPAPAYGAQMAPMYASQNAGYTGAPGAAPSPVYPAYAAPQYHPQPPPQRYPPPGGSPMTSYGSPTPGTPQQPQNWQPGYGSPTYQGRGASPSSHPLHPGIPYAFGQLPANSNPHDPKSQHPIPGSYNRNHNFNPKTQSFVPGSNDMACVPPGGPPPFAAPASHHGSPQIGAAPVAYPGYQQQVMPPQPYGGHGMMRQASNTSIPGYHPAQQPHMAPPIPYGHPPPAMVPPPVQAGPLQHVNPGQAMPSRPNVGPAGPPVFAHLPTYGNPATLPQKPATGY